MLFAASLLLFPQEQLTEHVSPERLRATLEELCRSSRLAGSPESKAAADYTAQVFKEAGLDVQRPKYLCHLPRQTKEGLWVTVQGQRSKLDLQERGFLEDHQSQLELVPPMHGLTHPGRVQGPVVFAGRGSEREFQELQDSGVELNGKIALIRYGGLYRGLKVHNAQEAGCVGALLYTDSEDDGEDKGVTMPEGPWRPHDGIQRGSVFNGDGEARTPGWPAHERAPRMALDEIEGLVRIPSLPISMKNARVLFGARSRPEQMGPIEASAEILVEQNSEPVWVENTIGTLKGRDESAEWVVVGAHRDAWGVGAVDNGSGMSVLLEAARILGQAQKDGWQPKRSIVFGAWDAEEWGLVGSTEWVEEHRAVLGARA
ncbi:MAG: M28 family peptidase, partial [Planctomycetes bacterium]|nr:M28 family peptidase [Planctomycetota bacterium]